MIRTKEFKDIHYWSKYNPFEPQYFRFTPNVIATGHKIFDVYKTFCTARSNLIFFECKKFGDLVNSEHEISVKYLKSNFIMNSLIYYNICIDLSWQVMWMFYNSESFDLMFDDIYTKSTKDCNFKSLLEFLNYQAFFPTPEKKKIILLKDHIKTFFCSKFVYKVREKYNYMKHRGSYHIDGLGLNDKSMSGTLNGINPLILQRQELDISEWYNILIDFDKEFVDYVETIIQELMPKDFFDTRIDISRMVNYSMKLRKYIGDKEI